MRVKLDVTRRKELGIQKVVEASDAKVEKVEEKVRGLVDEIFGGELPGGKVGEEERVLGEKIKGLKREVRIREGKRRRREWEGRMKEKEREIKRGGTGE